MRLLLVLVNEKREDNGVTPLALWRLVLSVLYLYSCPVKLQSLALFMNFLSSLRFPLRCRLPSMVVWVYRTEATVFHNLIVLRRRTTSAVALIVEIQRDDVVVPVCGL